MKARRPKRAGSRSFMWVHSQVVSEKFECALARQRGRLRVVRGALIAVEAVARAFVDVQPRRRDDARAHALDFLGRDARVSRAVVVEQRTARLALEVTRDPAVVNDGAGERQLSGGEVGEGPSPAVADARRAPGVPDDPGGPGDIAQRHLGGELPAVAPPLLPALRAPA